MTVGFTGTRDGMTIYQKASVASYLEVAAVQWVKVAHHGDCLGADADFHKIAKAAGYRTVGHPCDIPSQRAYCDVDECRDIFPPLVRNVHIVQASEFMIACPKGFHEEQRSGTWATIRRCKKAKHPLVIIWPDGTAELTNWVE